MSWLDILPSPSPTNSPDIGCAWWAAIARQTAGPTISRSSSWPACRPRKDTQDRLQHGPYRLRASQGCVLVRGPPI